MSTSHSRKQRQQGRTRPARVQKPRPEHKRTPAGQDSSTSANPFLELQQRVELLESEVHTYRHRLTIFRQASMSLTMDVSLDQALQGLAATAVDFFQAEAVSIMLWDTKQENMVLRTGSGLSADYLNQRIPFQRIQPLLAAGQDYLVTLDLQRSPFGDLELIRREGLVSALTVALHLGKNVVGLLNIYSRGKLRNFTLEEIENARLFAQQASIAFRNLQLVTELREEIQIANTLQQVAEDIGTLGSLDEVLTRITTILKDVLQFEVSTVFLWELDKKIYLPVKALGLPPHRAPFFHTLILHSSDLIFTLKELQQRAVIYAEKQPRRFPLEKLATVLGYKDLFLVPLVVKDQLLGAILTARYQGDQPFDAKAETFLRGIAAQAAIAINDANLFEELEKAFWDTIKSLAAAIEAKDHYTHDHSEAVIEYGTSIAKALNLSTREIEMVRKAALLHDVGKIGIEDNILRKVEPLTPEERRAIEQHPIIGQEILSSVHNLSEVSQIVRHHHEHFDGNGYPDHLQGQAIPLLSRILQIADSFDAMTSDRPYRKALTREEAIEQLKLYSGRQFDPELVSIFLEILKQENYQKQSRWS